MRKWKTPTHHLLSNKKLSYRRGTTQCSVLVSSCYLSQGMAVRKVSVSKSDRQGYSIGTGAIYSIGHVRFPISLLLQLCLFCTINMMLWPISKNLKTVTWIWTHPFGITHYACSSAPVTWPWPCQWGVVCHPKASTWYIPPAYEIWRLASFRGQDCWRWNWKCVVLPWPRPLKGSLSSKS